MIGKLLMKKQSRTNLLDNSSSPSSSTVIHSNPSSPSLDLHSNSFHHHQQEATFVNLVVDQSKDSSSLEKQKRIEQLKIQYPKLFEEVFEEEDEADICPICLELYTRDNPQILCKCSHGFHFQCSEEWKQRSNECPVCFRKLIYMYEDEELPPVEKNRNEKKQNPTIMMREPLYYSEDRPRRGFFGTIFSKYVIIVSD